MNNTSKRIKDKDNLVKLKIKIKKLNSDEREIIFKILELQNKLSHKQSQIENIKMDILRAEVLDAMNAPPRPQGVAA